MSVKQIKKVTALNLRNIPRRFGASLVIVVGIAAVTGVMLSVLSMGAGFTAAMTTASRSDRAVILSSTAEGEFDSGIAREKVAVIAAAPTIAKDTDGQALASAEALAGFPLPKLSDGLDAYVVLRGVGAKGIALRPELKLVEGRWFKPGTNELVVGTSAQQQYRGLDVGSDISLQEGDWKIVGSFTAGGDVIEGNLLADSESVYQTFRRMAFSSVIVQLPSADSLDALKSYLAANPTLEVVAERETDYHARVAAPFNGFLTLVGLAVGGVMGVGALFGALNIMYSSVSARRTEIGILRALGFSGGAVAASVLAEVLLLAVIGAVIGTGIAWAVFDGTMRSTGGNVFRLAVTPSLAAFGIFFACGLAALGGLFPAIRAARLPVTTALRAT